MTSQQAREYLKSFQYDCQYYKEKIKELRKFKVEVDFALKNANTNTQISKTSNKLKSIINKLSEKESFLIELFSKQQQLEREFDQLPQPYKNVLYMRYVCFLSFDQIASNMNYSSKRIYQFHAKGIEMYAKLKSVIG